MKTISKCLLAAASILSIGAFATTASAESNWARHHPRQHQVLAREHRQIARINHERREGEITAGQARAERATDRSFARQDRADARANGGYITRAQQHQLNAEENAQSHVIGR